MWFAVCLIGCAQVDRARHERSANTVTRQPRPVAAPPASVAQAPGPTLTARSAATTPAPSVASPVTGPVPLSAENAPWRAAHPDDDERDLVIPVDQPHGAADGSSQLPKRPPECWGKIPGVDDAVNYCAPAGSPASPGGARIDFGSWGERLRVEQGRTR